MSEQQVEAPAPPLEDDSERSGWGRVMDAAGILAGLLLLVIVADIWSDGRLVSRRLMRNREAGGEVEQRTPGD